jgi:hypothetical protein
MRIAAYAVIIAVEALLVVWFVRGNVPPVIGNYVAFCPDHLSACEDKVSEVDSALRLTYMPGEQYCPPQRPDRAGEERTVRTWLSARPEMRTRSTATSISAALLASHRCEVRMTGTSERRLRGGS